MSPTGELIDTETVTISSEGGGGKRAQPVSRKGLRTPAQAVPRQPPTLLHARFGGGRMEKVSWPVDRHCRSKRTAKRGSPALLMIQDRQPGKKSLFSAGFSVVPGRRGTGFIKSA